MGEKQPRKNSEAKRNVPPVRYEAVEMSAQEYLAKLSAQQANRPVDPRFARQQPPRQQRPQHHQLPPNGARPTQRPTGTSVERAPGRAVNSGKGLASNSEARRGKDVIQALPEKKLKRGAKIGLALGGAAIVVGGVGLSYNAFGIQDAVFGAMKQEGSTSMNGMDGVDLGIEEIPLQTLGTESLKPGQCEAPEAVLLKAEVSGELPLVPLLASKDAPTAEPAPPYIIEEKLKGLSKSEKSAFEDILEQNKDGYARTTLNDLPLAMTICETVGENAVTEKVDELIIDRSALTIRFRDPNQLFGENLIRAVYQNTDEDVNPEEGEYMTLPSPNLYLSLTKDEDLDEVYNKSVTDLSTSMVDPIQLQVLLAKMETEAIAQLDSVVDGHEGISYPDGAESLQRTIDKALVKRLIGDTSIKLSFTGNYNTPIVVVPIDESSKNPITTTVQLKNIDPSQTFKISEINVSLGGLTPPKAKPIPTPEPTPTETPAATPAP